ncbi:MAG: hypothetical protein IPI57_16525 [Candidatus Competibacteraceae bacterium]|nr:hypothetical protein [Candidatus Competibacteraceae bacterium]
MSRPAAVEPAAGRLLTPLSAAEKNIVAALFSWAKNYPGATLAEFEAAYRRAKGLAEGK